MWGGNDGTGRRRSPRRMACITSTASTTRWPVATERSPRMAAAELRCHVPHNAPPRSAPSPRPLRRNSLCRTTSLGCAATAASGLALARRFALRRPASARFVEVRACPSSEWCSTSAYPVGLVDRESLGVTAEMHLHRVPLDEWSPPYAPRGPVDRETLWIARRSGPRAPCESRAEALPS
jgi:hypothetical protein